MKQRVITAVIALLIFLPLIWFGGLPLEAATSLLAVVGVLELFHMKGLPLFSVESVVAALAAVTLVLPVKNWFFFLPSNVDNSNLFYLFVIILMLIPVLSKNKQTLDDVAFPVLVSLYVGTGFHYLVSARADGRVMIFYAFLVVWSTDIGAYLTGRQFGKNKLWPAISPNKSIEGAIGGILSAVFVAFVYLLCFPGKEFFPYSTFVMLILTVLFSVTGQLGDLVESAYKRHYGVKDSGKILPGHGGILDRFDSMLLVFPIMHILGVF